MSKTKLQIYRDAFGLFCTRPITNDMILNFINDVDGAGTYCIQEWITNNMKPSIEDWATAIGIIESVEHMYNSALSNANIK